MYMNTGALIPTFVYSFQVRPSLISQFFLLIFYYLYCSCATLFSFNNCDKYTSWNVLETFLFIVPNHLCSIFTLTNIVTIFLNVNLPNIIHVHCIMLYVHGTVYTFKCMWLCVCFYKLFSNTQINAKHMAQIVSNLFRRNQV